jgi:hypothetical protein
MSAEEAPMSDPQPAPTDAANRDAIPQESRGLVSEFVGFILYNKAWWMTPILLVLALMVGFILFVEGSPVLPFIYALI